MAQNKLVVTKPSGAVVTDIPLFNLKGLKKRNALCPDSAKLSIEEVNEKGEVIKTHFKSSAKADRDFAAKQLADKDKEIKSLNKKIADLKKAKPVR